MPRCAVSACLALLSVDARNGAYFERLTEPPMDGMLLQVS